MDTAFLVEETIMKRQKVLIILLLCTSFCFFSFAFTPAVADTIKVGIILPLTGKLAEFGQIENKSFLMALDEINAMGGVNGQRIELIIEDTAGKPDVGRSTVENLISQKKVSIMGGGYSSTVTWAAAAVAQQRKVPFMVNTGSADRITEKGWNYIFRLTPPVSEHYKALSSFLREATTVKTVAILHEQSLFGESGGKKFFRQCRDLGLRITMKGGYEVGVMDFEPLLTKVKEKNPDLVYMVSHVADAALLIRQSKELRISPRLFLGGTADFALREFRTNAGSASEYVFSTALWTPSVPYPGAKAFYNRFIKRYHHPTDYHGAQAYAAMYVIADALKRAGSSSPRDVRDALARTDLMTVFGPVKFVSYGNKTQQNSLPVPLVQWINGRLETVWPQRIATTKYVYPLPPWDER